LSMTGVHVSYPRYVVPMVPVLAVLSADVVATVCSRRTLAAFFVVAVLVAPGLWRSIRFDHLAAREDTRVLAANWIGDHVPRRSRIALCEGYGAPKVNADRRRPPAFEPVEITCNVSEVRGVNARYVVTHEHPFVGLAVPPDLESWLRAHGSVEARFDPLRDDVDDSRPYFYRDDAFYLPISGFGRLDRGGPIVTVWELDN